MLPAPAPRPPRPPPCPAAAAAPRCGRPGSASRRGPATLWRVSSVGGGRRRRKRWRRPDRSRRAGAQVVAIGVAVLRLRVADRPIARIVRRVEAVAAADAIPVGVHDAGGAPHRAWTAPRAVVLQAAADVVGLPHVHADRVELAERREADLFPRLALVVADVEAAVVADDEVLIVARVDPERVVVAVALVRPSC